MQIPFALRSALEREAARYKLNELQRAHERLSESYRAGRPLGLLDDAERVAYATARMPATFGACTAVLAEVAARFADAAPATPPTTGLASVLDLGAGTGALLWAAAEVLPGISQATLIEADPGMIQLGRVLASQGECVGHSPALLNALWLQADLRGQALAQHDLVVCSYSLGELESGAAEQVLRVAWAAARHALVIIEPGTPAGFTRVRQWREQLLAPGNSGAAHMIAPCPHAASCPMAGDNWCHFAQRVERTSLHRRLKGGELGYEDEKFSYIAISKSPVPRPAARVIRHPRVAAGAIQLELCATEGLQKIVATKRNREQFRRARHARWGDAWETASTQSLRLSEE